MTEAYAVPPDALAPWAELVPGTALATVDDLFAVTDGSWRYEMVEGRLVRMPPSGFRASRIAMRLGARLTLHVDTHDLGAVTSSDGAFDVSSPGMEATGHTVLAPDVAFVRVDHLPPHVAFDQDKAVPFAPDLAVEIASPNQYRPAMAAKARRYLAAGTRLVWIIWPARREIDVWLPGHDAPVETVREDGMLDGRDAVPGFTCPVADLFA